MNSIKARSGALASIAVLLLLGGNAAFANTSQPISITVTGTVLNAGDQHYNVHGGNLGMAMIDGQPLSTTSKLDYTLDATVHGLKAKGTAHIKIDGTTVDNVKVHVDGDLNIKDMIAQDFPLACTTSCNSAIPFFFTGDFKGHIKFDKSPPQEVKSTLMIESPYFNPFGNPITILSDDGSVVLAATYDKGTIDWTHTQVGGILSGIMGSTPNLVSVSGSFTLAPTEHEDLVAGTARDEGNMSFTGMTPSILNFPGNMGDYHGTSIIPTAGSFDCSTLPLPFLPGTCTMTGFQSTGQFNLHSGKVTMAATYSTTWGVPALFFSSSASGTVTQK